MHGFLSQEFRGSKPLSRDKKLISLLDKKANSPIYKYILTLKGNIMNSQIQLTEAQQLRKSYIIKCIGKEMSALEAGLRLCLTERTIYKNMADYRKKGDMSFIHGNTGKRHVRPEIEERRQKVLDIFQNTRVAGENPFPGVTYTYFTQILEEDYGMKCSVSWTKKTLNSVGYRTPVRYRKKRQREAHLFRERKEHAGELVQADGTPFDWFGDGRKYCIQGFIDDATGIPVGLHMTKNECLLGYMEALRKMLTGYGIPMQLYPDKAGVFFVNGGRKDGCEKPLTQFGRMMERLGVDMFPAHSPQAKGRIERFWQTLQQQLPVQLRLHGIKTVDAANEFIEKTYLPKFIRRHAVRPKNAQSLWVSADTGEINGILRASYTARTDKGGVFSFKGYRFFCPTLPNTKISVFLNERDGIWAAPHGTDVRHEIILVETDTTGPMPDVLKLLIEKVFLRNAKPRYREVYIDDEKLEEFIRKKQTA